MASSVASSEDLELLGMWFRMFLASSNAPQGIAEKRAMGTGACAEEQKRDSQPVMLSIVYKMDLICLTTDCCGFAARTAGAIHHAFISEDLAYS
jgi:hypothetical protein